MKEEKSYSYWPALIAEILCKRAEDQETAARHVTVSPTNPQHLAPTIAMRSHQPLKIWSLQDCQGSNSRHHKNRSKPTQ